MKLTRKESVHRRHRRVRRKVFSTAERPRLAVFRSEQHIYAQVIDDTAQHTLAAASTLDPELKAELSSGNNLQRQHQSRSVDCQTLFQRWHSQSRVRSRRQPLPRSR